MNVGEILLSLANLGVAGFATFYIPEKMMNNQLYAGLITEYREPEIGEAVIAVIDFYTNDCNSDITRIEDEYLKRYEKEVAPLDKEKRINHYIQESEAVDINRQDTKCNNKEFKNTLHFQRRLLSQYYYQLAALRYEGCRLTRLSQEKVREDFTAREAKLLRLLIEMNKAAEKKFIEYDVGDIPYILENKQNVLLEKLYDEAQQW